MSKSRVGPTLFRKINAGPTARSCLSNIRSSEAPNKKQPPRETSEGGFRGAKNYPCKFRPSSWQTQVTAHENSGKCEYLFCLCPPASVLTLVIFWHRAKVLRLFRMMPANAGNPKKLSWLDYVFLAAAFGGVAGLIYALVQATN